MLMFVLGSASLALDAREFQSLSVGGQELAWQWLALLAFVVFAILSSGEQFRLRSALNVRKQYLETISKLSPLVMEGRVIERSNPGRSGIFIPTDEPSSEDQSQRIAYQTHTIEWCHKVRHIIESRCPEFIAQWETSEDRPLELLGIIKELRGHT